MTGKSVTLPGDKKVDVDTYERNIEADIRRLKSRLRLLISGQEPGVRIKLDCLKANPPKRTSLVQKRYIQKKTPKIPISRHGNGSSLTKDMHQ